MDIVIIVYLLVSLCYYTKVLDLFFLRAVFSTSKWSAFLGEGLHVASK